MDIAEVRNIPHRKSPHTLFIERNGRLNPIVCSNYFTQNQLSIPLDLQHATKRELIHFYAFSCTEGKEIEHTFYEYDTNKLSKNIPPHFDMATYKKNTMVIFKFLREIQQSTRRIITNIHLFYSATIGDATNTLYKWHDDRNFAEGKDTRQMAIMLTEGELTEFAVGQTPKDPDEALNEKRVLKCPQTSVGSATYWRNPITHRKPLQKNNQLRVALLITFDFFNGDEKTIDSIYSSIEHIEEPLLKMSILNDMRALMQKEQYEMFDRELEILLGGGDLPIDCSKETHPTCKDMFGGKKETHEGKYKYKGRWYKVRYGARGGRHIVVKGVVKYV